MSSFLLAVLGSESLGSQSQLVCVTPKCYNLIRRSRAVACCNDLTGVHLIVRASGPLPTGRLVLVQSRKRGRELYYDASLDSDMESRVQDLSRQDLLQSIQELRKRKPRYFSVASVSALSTALGSPISATALTAFLKQDDYVDSNLPGVVAAHAAWLNAMRKWFVKFSK